MNKNFGEKSIVIRYIQQYLNENYNNRIIVDGNYYGHVDMNYGLAHFVAKYLDYMYPVLDPNVQQEYDSIDTQTPIRKRTEPISIMNYFLCSNKGTRLQFDPLDSTAPNVLKTNEIYDKIYNQYMQVRMDSEGEIKLENEGRYIIQNDLPLFVSKNGDTYSINTNIIFTLESWDNDKQICELDDYIVSFLLGRTIGPNSSMEDIYRAQQLLIRDRNIQKFEKGVWCSPGNEGTIYDMTRTVTEYQKNILLTQPKSNIVVTGYFDIFTEAFALKEVGENRNGIFGL